MIFSLPENEQPDFCAEKIEEVKIANWIESKPDLKVIFTARAEKNLAQFTGMVCDKKLSHIGGEAELRRAICDILTADPRSNYRRDKCRDRLYYFSVDNANVTCWFDFDFEAAEEKTEIVEVLKIEFKPVRRDE